MLVKTIRLLVFLILISAFLAVFSRDFRNIPYSIRIKHILIPISGTGSMYPTFPKGTGKTDENRAAEIVTYAKMFPYPGGISILNNRFFSYLLKQGDIVEIKNNKTDEITKEKYGEETGFVKRVIGLPGDLIELRDGFVYRNGLLIDEPYIAKARSTYGGDTIPDCSKITIPKGEAIVLGDNRKASLDSRYELGLIKLSDIHYVLPFENQTEYQAVWRDSSKDSQLADTAALNSAEFINLLNQKRLDNSISSLKSDFNLAKSSKIRGNAMIEFNDFSIEATQSSKSLKESLKEANYTNITYAEVYSRGYYESEELIDNLFEFPNTSKLLLSPEYQDIGVDTAIGSINGCPGQVAVVHLGGYIPPNYSKSEIESWEKLINQIHDVLPSWEEALTSDGIDTGKVEGIISLLKERRDAAEKIYTRMKANEYLTDEEQLLASDDSNKSKRLESLIGEIVKE